MSLTAILATEQAPDRVLASDTTLLLYRCYADTFRTRDTAYLRPWLMAGRIGYPYHVATKLLAFAYDSSARPSLRLILDPFV